MNHIAIPKGAHLVLVDFEGELAEIEQQKTWKKGSK